MSRKWMVSVVAVAMLTLAACGDSEAADAGSEGGSTEPLKVGLINSYEGPFADLIDAAHVGAELAVAEVNADGGVNGRQIELISKDDQMTPEGGTAAMRQLLDDGVEHFIGALTTPVCQALGDLATQRDALFIALHCTANAVTGPDRPENLFRVSVNDTNMNTALGKTIAEDYPDLKQMDVFGFDYATGHEFWKISFESAVDAGLAVKSGEEHWVPLTEQNYRPQVQALARSLDADSENRGLFLATYGAGTSSFFQQAEPLGLLEKYGMIAASGTYYPVARAMDGRAPEVLNGYEYWYSCFDNPKNEAFVAAFEEKTGEKPIAVANQAYTAIHFLAAGLEEAGTSEVGDVISALEGLEIDTTMGPVTMSAQTHQALVPAVVTLSRGNPDEPEGIETVRCHVVPGVDAG